MAKLWWLLMLGIVMGVCLPAGAVGGEDDAAGVGMLAWATGLQTQSQITSQVTIQNEGTVGQVLGEGIGLSEQLRTRLTTRESSNAAVELPDVPEENLVTQEALGAVSQTREQMRERVTYHGAQGASATETPSQFRTRVMARLGTEAQ